jgi:MtaA/CmuA family methyltransferase
MLDRVEGVALLKQRAGGEKIVEGWVEGPCAMGADLRGINTLMLDFNDDAGFVRDLFEFSVQMEVAFGKAQIAAGADLIGVGDAAASLVGPSIYEQFVWPYERKLIDGLRAAGGRVRLHICGKTRRLFLWMGQLAAEIVDLDWMAPLEEARRAMGPAQVLLGNIDPVEVLRNKTPESVRTAIAECHRQAGPRYIVGAGCEVVRDTPEDNLRALCEYARTHRPESSPQGGSQ